MMNPRNCLLVLAATTTLSFFSTNLLADPTNTKGSQEFIDGASLENVKAELSSANAVTDLSFNDFFKMPIGPAGLEPTEKLLKLNHKTIRIKGYMAHEDDPSPGIFLLTARPAMVAEKADGMADDLPAATLAVHMPIEDKEKILTYRPGQWDLTGTLELGNQEDSNGRISYARLIMNKTEIKAQKAHGKSAATQKHIAAKISSTH